MRSVSPLRFSRTRMRRLASPSPVAPLCPRRGWASRLAFVLALGLVLPSCSRQRRPGIPPKNLLVVTIDNLRPDHLSCYGYLRPTGALGPLHDAENALLPVTFDYLADSGVLFASAYAPSSSTMPSLASLFTGRGPLETGVVDEGAVVAAEIPTLAEILGQAGFVTAACVTPRRVDPRAWPRRGFETFEIGADDETTIHNALQWMKRDFGNDRPFFLWLHLSGLVPDWKHPGLDGGGGPGPAGLFVDPDYRGPADGSARYLERVARGELVPTAEDRAHTTALYDGGIVHVLGLLGDFLLQSFAYQTSEAEATECWSRTLLVLTSPHGIQLTGEGELAPGEAWPGPSLDEDVLHVPLVLRHPDSLTGERILEDPIELQDLLPTVLEWFDIAVPAGVRGRSLLACTDAFAQRRFEPRPIFTSSGDRLFSVRTERWHLIWSPHSSATSGARARPSVRLYDHLRDREELHDVAAANPDVVKDLQGEIRAWRRAQLSPGSRAETVQAAASTRAPVRAAANPEAPLPPASAR